MNKSIAAAFLVVALSAFQACDTIEGPYSDLGSGSGANDTNQYVRKILIEDFTGHTCGNCPAAANVLHQIHELYGDKVISMGVHAGFFAEPTFAQPADYRTVTGNELDAYFGNSSAGLPNGLVNRMTIESNPIVQYNNWSSLATTLLAEAPQAWLKITNTWDPASRNLSTSVKTSILQPISDSLNIAYYLVEDSIMSPQKDYSIPEGIIENYYHRHVLRGAMSGTWGTGLAAGTAFSTGQEFTTTANFTLPAEWDASHVSVIAVLYHANSKEVVQTEEKKAY